MNEPPRSVQSFSRVLAIASNSFTGAHFVNHVLETTNAQVVGVSRSEENGPVFLAYRYRKSFGDRFAFHRMDLNREMDRFAAMVEAFKPELVVNFAAQGEVRNSWRWPHEWYETNTLAVARLSEILRDRPHLKRYVSISTPEVYGNTGLDTKENETYRPSTPYAVSKLAGDLHLQALERHYGFPVVYTRAANVYGIHQQLYRILPRTIIYLRLGKRLTLHGGGQTERAFIHARDVASATLRAAERGGRGAVYHLAPQGELRSIASVVEMVCDMMGRRFEDSVELVEENFGQDARFSLDASKARQELGWKPQVRFEEGVEEMVRWISDNWEAISKHSLDYEHIHN